MASTDPPMGSAELARALADPPMGPADPPMGPAVPPMAPAGPPMWCGTAHGLDGAPKAGASAAAVREAWPPVGGQAARRRAPQTQPVEELHGALFSADDNPRANIFKKTAPEVQTLADIRAEMRRRRGAVGDGDGAWQLRRARRRRAAP